MSSFMRILVINSTPSIVVKDDEGRSEGKMVIKKNWSLLNFAVFIVFTCAACASKPPTVEQRVAAVERYVEQFPDKSLTELRGLSDTELCQRYDSPQFAAAPTAMRIVEAILQERNVTRCQTRVVPAKAAPVPTANDNWATSFVVRWGDQSDFSQDFADIAGAPSERDPFETDVEFAARKVAYASELVAKWEASGIGYRITLPINNPENKNDRRAYFHPERGQLCIPMFERLVGVGKATDGKNTFEGVNHYYIQLESVTQATHRQGGIFVTAATTSGLAILHDDTGFITKGILPMLSVSVSGEVARDILSNGKILFEVVPDYRDLRGQQDSFIPYLVVANSSTQHIDVERQMGIGVLKENHGLPVRLLAVSLLDSENRELTRAEGWKIGTALVSNHSEGCGAAFQ